MSRGAAAARAEDARLSEVIAVSRLEEEGALGVVAEDIARRGPGEGPAACALLDPALPAEIPVQACVENVGREGTQALQDVRERFPQGVLDGLLGGAPVAPRAGRVD